MLLGRRWAEGVDGQLQKEGRGSQVWSSDVFLAEGFGTGPDSRECELQKWLPLCLGIGLPGLILQMRKTEAQKGQDSCPTSQPRH